MPSAAGSVPGRRLLDASSGNTGIAYAMLGAAAGIERHDLPSGQCQPRAKGAARSLWCRSDRHRSPRRHRGRRRRARELAEAEPERYFYADQYGNPANPQAHRDTTGPEIWTQTDGRITHFVAAMGTTGTMMGTGGYLKEKYPGIVLVGRPARRALSRPRGSQVPAERRCPPAIYDPSVPDVVAEIATERADTPRDCSRGRDIWSAGPRARQRRRRSTSLHGSPRRTSSSSAAIPGHAISASRIGGSRRDHQDRRVGSRRNPAPW